MSDFRHHRAGRDGPVVVFVPVPVAGPEHIQRGKPGPYPKQGRDAWRPATLPPRRMTKSEKTVDLMRNIVKQDQDVRAYLDDMRRISAEMRQAREQVNA
jgi:hypothetical protein